MLSDEIKELINDEYSSFNQAYKNGQKDLLPQIEQQEALIKEMLVKFEGLAISLQYDIDAVCSEHLTKNKRDELKQYKDIIQKAKEILKES